MYQNIVSNLSESLQRKYGKHSLEPGLAPIDYLILGILSQHTNDVNARRAFESFRKTFPNYLKAVKAPVSMIENEIKPGGLQKRKARLIKKLLKEIWGHHHSFDLSFLRNMKADEAKIYLCSFKGIGLKTACFCLLFGLGIPVMPVDGHVLRVTRRIGLVDPTTGADETHQFYQEFLRKNDFLDMHVNLIELGRKICRPQEADCPGCAISRKCRYSLMKKMTSPKKTA